MFGKKDKKTASRDDFQKRIEQMRSRLQELDQQVSQQNEAAAEKAATQAQEIVSRAQAEADNIRSGAQAEAAQVVEQERAQALAGQDDLRQELASLQQEKAALVSELDGLSARIKGLIGTDAAEQSLPTDEPAAADEPIAQNARASRRAEMREQAQVSIERTPNESETTEAAAEATAKADEQAQVKPPVKTSEEQIREALADKPRKSHWKGILAAIIVLALAVVLVTQLLLGFTKMRDEAMETSISQGDTILYSRTSKQPHTNELTVFENKAGLLCVRRTIGRSGDTVDYDPETNQMLVNEKAIPNIPSDVEWWGVEESFEFPITVQDGEVFVLCSNRERPSNEGLIKLEQVKGKVIKIF